MSFMSPRFLLGAVTLFAALPVVGWAYAAQPGGGPVAQISSDQPGGSDYGVLWMVAGSKSSSSASASASSSTGRAGEDGECVAHVRSTAQAEANGVKQTDQDEKIVRGKGKDCNAKASAKATATTNTGETEEN